MTKSMYAFQTRNIRYIVGAQGLNPQQILNKVATTRYNVDGQGLRYDIFWRRRGKIQFIIDSQGLTLTTWTTKFTEIGGGIPISRGERERGKEAYYARELAS